MSVFGLHLILYSRITVFRPVKYYRWKQEVSGMIGSRNGLIFFLSIAYCSIFEKCRCYRGCCIFSVGVLGFYCQGEESRCRLSPPPQHLRWISHRIYIYFCLLLINFEECRCGLLVFWCRGVVSLVSEYWVFTVGVRKAGVGFPPHHSI